MNELSRAQTQAANELKAARESYRAWAETIADALLDGDLVWSSAAMLTENEAHEETDHGAHLKAIWHQASEVFLGTLTPFIQEQMFELDGRIGA